MKSVSMEIIAKQLNVSTVTVHKALNNQKGVSEQLKTKILQLAGQLGYESPKIECNNFIFLIHKNLILNGDDSFFSQIYNYINDECVLAGAKLNLIVHDNLAATLNSIKTVLDNDKLSGFFIAGNIDRDIENCVAKLKKPTVFVDCKINESDCDEHNFNYISTDNFFGGYALTEHLISYGHKNIGFIGDISFSATADRYFGYLKALLKNGISPNQSYFINSNIESNFQTKLPLNLPTAYICHSDRAAIKLYALLKAQNITIGEQVSVAAFNNSQLCEFVYPTLTSVSVPLQLYAKLCTNYMLKILNPLSVPLNYLKINPQIYHRQSVKDLTK